ncbi:DUF4352 domain-containing protein [Actinocorallia herbida]|uniref:DUF4352 domain-containing protein n=1 Tax=Actinocorallia herbida TaxID=58109 RepID=UPI0014769BD5|nr:DUF4352 domain-containing protein [Actinocorallia herbida]
MVLVVGCSAVGERPWPGGESVGATKPVVVGGGVGETVRDGDVVFKVTKVRKGPREVKGETAQGRFVLLYVTVRNEGDTPLYFAGGEQKLLVGGKAYEGDAELAARMGDRARSLLEEIGPGKRLKGIVVYDIPKGARPDGVELHASVLSDGVLVRLDGL